MDSLVERITSEGGIGLGEAARRLGSATGGRGGKPVHPSTLSRWAHRGVRSADGGRVRLEHIVLPGGRILTSWPAVCRFLERLQPTDGSVGAAVAQPVRTPAARRRAADRAGDILASQGC